MKLNKVDPTVLPSSTTLWLFQWFSMRMTFVPQGTSGNVRRHFFGHNQYWHLMGRGLGSWLGTMHRTMSTERIVWPSLSMPGLSSPDPALRKYPELSARLGECLCPAACQNAQRGRTPPRSRAVYGAPLQLPLRPHHTDLVGGREAGSATSNLNLESCLLITRLQDGSGRARGQHPCTRCTEPSLRQRSCQGKAAPGKAIKFRALPLHPCSHSPTATPTFQGSASSGDGRVIMGRTCTGHCGGDLETGGHGSL